MMPEEKNGIQKENKEKQLSSLENQLKNTISEEGEEKLKFLKREEIRTMKKDVARLREIEAEKERERIMALEAEKGKGERKKEGEEKIKEDERKKKEKEKFIAMEVKERERQEKEKRERIIALESEKGEEQIEEQEKERKEEITAREAEKEEVEVKEPELEKEILLEETLIPRPPKRPPSFKKILVRIEIVLFLTFIITGLYWFSTSGRVILEDILVDFFTIPKGQLPEPKEEEPKITIPSSFVPIKETKTFEISKNEDIPFIIEQLKVEGLAESGFTRIVIKNVTENRLANLKDIAQGFQLETLPEVVEKLDIDNFNFLIYPQKEGKREIFIIKIKEKENLSEALRNWETKITQQGLFILGNKVSATASSFKTFTFDDESSIQYLTISKDDLGVCYSLFGNYFILSSSFESIEKTLRVLKTSPISSLEQDLGQLFIVGFEGKTITPQLESFFKKYRPGGVLLLSKNIESEQQLKNLITGLQNLSQRETGLPLFITVDQEGGPVSRIEFLEEKTAQSAINSTDDAYRIGLKRGQELKELGVNINLAPLLDYMGSGDFYFNRCFQKSPLLSGSLAQSLILGQKEAGILTTVKHFPGYVNIAFNPESKLATISTPEISQFKQAMEAEPELIMISNAIYTDIDPALPLTFSDKGIEYLKNNLGSEALVVSDDLSQTSLLNRFSLKEIMTKPIEAGVDILIFSGWVTPVDQALDSFLEAVSNKEISETKIEQAIVRIIKLKQTLQ